MQISSCPSQIFQFTPYPWSACPSDPTLHIPFFSIPSVLCTQSPDLKVYCEPCFFIVCSSLHLASFFPQMQVLPPLPQNGVICMYLTLLHPMLSPILPFYLCWTFCNPALECEPITLLFLPFGHFPALWPWLSEPWAQPASLPFCPHPALSNPLSAANLPHLLPYNFATSAACTHVYFISYHMHYFLN